MRMGTFGVVDVAAATGSTECVFSRRLNGLEVGRIGGTLDARRHRNRLTSSWSVLQFNR